MYVSLGLSELSYPCFVPGRSIQKKEHCSVEDSRAAMDLYRHIQTEWERQLEELQDCQDTKQKPTRGDCEPSSSLENSFLDDAYWVEFESMDL